MSSLDESLFKNLPRFKICAFQIISLIPEWARAYGVAEEAITRQLAYAHGWITTNPRRAPKNIPRFLFNWMRKAKEYGNLKVPEPAKLREPESVPDMSYEEMVLIRKCNMTPLKQVVK